MKIWCVLNTNTRDMVAFHEDKDIVEIYVDNLEKDSGSNLEVCKCKIDQDDLSKYRDLYLVPYKKTYVQEGYISFLDIVNDRHAVDDLKFTREILQSLVERDLVDSSKKKKKVMSVVNIINDLIDDDGHYTPSIETLKGYEMNFNSYNAATYYN